MALLYPWATKEYLLWEMTIGQIIMYYNKGIEIKYGTEKTKSSGLVDMSEGQLRAWRDEMKQKYGAI
jgi:hypothetical protein